MPEITDPVRELVKERHDLRLKMGTHLSECPACRRIGARTCPVAALYLEFNERLERQILETVLRQYRDDPGTLEVTVESGRVTIRGDRAGLTSLCECLHNLLVDPDNMSSGRHRKGERWLEVQALEHIDA